MRVLHVTSTFPRDDDDPSGHYLATLAAAQRAAGVEVRVLAPHAGGLATEDIVRGIPVTRFRYAPERAERLSRAGGGGLLASTRRSPAALLVPIYVAAMARATTRLAPGFDVVHAHWWLPGGLAAAMATRAAGVPLAVTLHGSDVHLLRHRIARPVATRVFGDAAAVTAVSEALAADARDRLGLGQRAITVIPMPLPVAERREPPSPPPPLRLAAVGRLAPEKGFDVLIDAAWRLTRAGTKVRLDVVGDGPSRAALEAAGSGLDIVWHGAVGPARAAAVMAAAHAVVVPSRREGLGLVAVEALALGRPVVASDVGGLPEVVVDGVDGLLVPPGDAGALADALSRLPLPPPVGAAVANHDPATVAERYLMVYRLMLHNRAPRRPEPQV